MIRALDVADKETANRIVDVQRAAYAVEAALVNYAAIPPLVESAADLQGSGEDFFGWEEEGELLGVVSVLRGPRLLEICRLCVHPAAFRRGIGRALLAAAEAQAGPGAAAGAVTTAAANAPALALYAGAGYRIVRRRTLPDGLALVELEKACA